MNLSNSKKILTILFGFFIIGFADVVGISTNYAKQDFDLSDFVSNLLPFMIFLWFGILSVPTASIINKFIDVGLNTTIPKFLNERNGLELGKAGRGTSLYFIARTFGTFLGSILLLRYTSRSFMLISILCAIPVLIILLFVSKLWIILCLIFILGLAVANVFSIIFSAALDKKPDQVNEVSGLLIMGIAGGALFPLLMGSVSDYFGHKGGMAILLIPLFFLLFSTFYLKKETSQ